MSAIYRGNGHEPLDPCPGCGELKMISARLCRACWKRQVATVATEAEHRARLLRRLDMSGGPDACWPIANGIYGRFTLYSMRLRAHRASYQLLVGAIPAGLNVLHSCDNPPCCNPRHLWVGTQKQNGEDMARKGRASHEAAKQSADDVRAIRAARSAGRTLADIAAEYGTVESVIHTIVTGKRYRWVSA